MKDTIRKEMISIRRKITNKKKKSTIIVDKIINLKEYQDSNTIAIYSSMSDEVDTSKLINLSLKEKIVLLPRVFNNKMIFIKIDKDTKYIKNTMGFQEPIACEYLDKIDLIIVPGVSFDKSLNRLGFGKGYYDKYLTNKSIYKIGICFDEQIVNSLPTDSHDIKMDLIITEKEFYK